MRIIDKFVLLKDVPNILDMSESSMSSFSDPEDVKNLIRVIRLIQSRVSHFTSKRIYNSVSSDSDALSLIHVAKLPNYVLPVSYNKRTQKIVINLKAFGVNEISRLDPKTIYGALAYGICFKDLVTGKLKVKDAYYSPISQFLTTMFVRIFGKEFGLLGSYATELPKLKFLISCYVLNAFFGITGSSTYSKAMAVSAFNYKEYEKDLKKYDFSNINDFINSLSDLKVMPGLNKHMFTAKFYRHFTLNFLPAIEDCARFISSMLVINISGSGIIPGFIYTYNVSEYEKILSMIKPSFK